MTNDTEYYVLDYIAERKKLDDLASSIKDNRYKEQKARLKFSRIPNIFYIVEGFRTSFTTLPQQSLESAIINTQICDGFKVKRTDSIHQTAKWLSQLSVFITRRVAQQIDSLQLHDTLHLRQTLTDFLNNNKKSGQCTVNHYFGQMLRNLRSSGPEVVQMIISLFRTPKQLYIRLNKFELLKSKEKYLLQVSKLYTEQQKEQGNPNIRNINKKLCNLICSIFGERVQNLPAAQPVSQREAASKKKNQAEKEYEFYCNSVIAAENSLLQNQRKAKDDSSVQPTAQNLGGDEEDKENNLYDLDFLN